MPMSHAGAPTHANRHRRFVEGTLLLTLALFSTDAAAACRPIAGLSDLVHDLNRLWRTSVLLCDAVGMRGPRARADVHARRVYIDSRWLDEISWDYGRGAPAGIIAHEWAHVAHRATELQADCLAGFAMSILGFSRRDVRDFAVANSWHASPSHGTSEQRVEAALRGYYDGPVRVSHKELMTGLCPPGVR